MGVTDTATPLVAGRFPGVMTPVPPANTPVSCAVAPAEIVEGFAVKLVIVGAAGGVGVLLPLELPPPQANMPNNANAPQSLVIMGEMTMPTSCAEGTPGGYVALDHMT